MRINCKNGTSEAMLLIVEPWAEEYWLEPGVSVDVIGKGGAIDGSFEVEYFDKGIIFYGWEGSVVSVFVNGQELAPSQQC
ncbi:hypothetical protein NJC38_05925 [Pseudomonas sp. 21LCFQ010]|uniref:hypothetical protein n=1 Tax=Pseudomonas sp. 21LCFQ010 TaxID=2957506 RepID=UPI0020977813|nr:hypothetical protein [Pseudomonas sp. 21LCFQ010]MCO8161691.1 hypothetical protein [Pseudomonas sp. 21LCFQ010]